MHTGLWPAVARRFEADTGYKVVVTVSGNRWLLDEAFRAGEADLLTMHDGDNATGLLDEGFGVHLRPWTRNEFVILGPASDPANIRGLRDGAVALQRIARAQAPFVNFQNSGSRDITSRLWQTAGVTPQGAWLLQDESTSSEEAMAFAHEMKAYVLLGRIPSIQGIFPSDGLEILVQGDPAMRRSFIVMEANAERLPGANTLGARVLSDYLLSKRTQRLLLEFGTYAPGQMPQFYPGGRD